MKILKFGGKSLASDLLHKNVVHIIKKEFAKGSITVVVSAIGETTNALEKILEQAKNGRDFDTEFESLAAHFLREKPGLKEELQALKKLFEGVLLLRDYTPKIKDQVLAYGELISSHILVEKLAKEGLKALAVDSRKLLVTDHNFGEAQILNPPSEKKTRAFFRQIDSDTIPIVTGFIGATKEGITTTLGRNGSNYSASLLANYLKAEEVQNYTHVDGVFTANPEWVKDAQKINALNFNEANELAQFGADILHAKTIIPLVENKIPLRILNTLNLKSSGTLISAKSTPKGIKSLSVISDLALVSLEGRGLLGKVGIDARIFAAVARAHISIRTIIQGASERGLGFLVKATAAQSAEKALRKEFEADFYSRDVHKISIRDNIALISIIGQDLQGFHKPYDALIRNKIHPILLSNTLTGKNVSIAVTQSEAKKAVNVIHGQIFGISKKINIAILGCGKVGGTLIDQILKSAPQIEKKKGILLRIFAIGNSKKLLLDEEGIAQDWRDKLQNTPLSSSYKTLQRFAQDHHLENLVAVDNTASPEIITNYLPLIKAGFDLVSSNKLANTTSFDFYKKLRKALRQHHKEYLYEANVGAGLPLIDTLKLLHLSGEHITKIRGVFSGSLSYLFNTWAEQKESVTSIITRAVKNGFMEPDPREDLSGKDVARKLLILARELDLQNELEEVSVESLIPKKLTRASAEEFWENITLIEKDLEKSREKLNSDEVLKYVGELEIPKKGKKGKLSTRLAPVSVSSVLGQLKGADNLFEIFTESYANTPLIIQGSGAGAAVTARGVFGDILRLAQR